MKRHFFCKISSTTKTETDAKITGMRKVPTVQEDQDEEKN
jgi:hypothetical protein